MGWPPSTVYDLGVKRLCWDTLSLVGKVVSGAENIQRKLSLRVFMGLEEQDGKYQVPHLSLHCQKVQGSEKKVVSLGWDKGCHKIVEMFKSM